MGALKDLFYHRFVYTFITTPCAKTLNLRCNNLHIWLLADTIHGQVISTLVESKQ